MLRELFKCFRLNFSRRLFLYIGIVIAFALLGTPLLPIVAVKLASLFFLLIASGIFVPIFVSQFVSRLELLLIHRHRVRLPISKEIASLSERMGVKVKELGIVKGCTAYVIGGTIVLGTELLRRLTFEQRQAVVAHELGHVKKKHSLVSTFSMFLVLVTAYFCFSNLYVPAFFLESSLSLVLLVAVNIGMLVFVMTAFIPISWHLEKKADEVAAKFAGKENIKSALLALVDKEDLEEPSETHLSPRERIKHIDKF